MLPVLLLLRSSLHLILLTQSLHQNPSVKRLSPQPNSISPYRENSWKAVPVLLTSIVIGTQLGGWSPDTYFWRLNSREELQSLAVWLASKNHHYLICLHQDQRTSVKHLSDCRGRWQRSLIGLLSGHWSSWSSPEMKQTSVGGGHPPPQPGSCYYCLYCKWPDIRNPYHILILTAYHWPVSLKLSTPCRLINCH